jgi:hypothetical protein
MQAISHFRHQDTQTPPSPRVGEGGGGTRGKGAWDYRKPLISPKKSTLERSATPRRRQRRPGVWRGACGLPTVKTGLLSCCLRGRRHPGMCKNSDAALRLDSFAFVTSLQKRTAETPGSQSFPLQHFSDTLTTVHICRVARDACVQRSVDRNLFRSSRGARHSQEYSTLFIRFNLCENCYNRALRLLRLV